MPDLVCSRGLQFLLCQNSQSVREISITAR